LSSVAVKASRLTEPEIVQKGDGPTIDSSEKYQNCLLWQYIQKPVGHIQDFMPGSITDKGNWNVQSTLRGNSKEIW